jgi:predicted  nucleic acid-binding Zn-ribbon protein
MAEQEVYFETVYNEYKQYENFLREVSPKIKKEREDFEKYVSENADKQEVLIEKLFDLNEKPIQFSNDLLKLQVKLIYTYEALKDIVNIPQEQQKEIESFIKPKMLFLIEGGEAKEIDPEVNKEIRTKVKEQYKDFVKNLIQK